MGYKTFRQNVEPWKYVPYPKAPYYLFHNGCGCVAVTDIIVSNPKYANENPRTVAKYMVSKGYATRGNGTTRAGITETLRHYGFKCIRYAHAPNSNFWQELAKGGRAGVILFRGGTRGGVTWTKGGHYVAFTNYKYENGQHKLYTRDPNAGRHNDGWHSYEKTMKGLIVECWIAYLPASATTYTRYVASADGYANYRKGRGTQFAIMGKIPSGEKLTLTGYSGGWYRIKDGEGKGYYIHESVLSKTDLWVHTYKALQIMNVREKPDLNSKKVGQVKEGAVLKSSKISGTWVYIPDKKGWIRFRGKKEYLKMV